MIRLTLAVAVFLTACGGEATTTTTTTAQTTTTLPPTTTTTTLNNPNEGRPQLPRFGFVRHQWDELDAYCTENFPRDDWSGAECHDAIQAQKGVEFESWLIEAEQAILDQLAANTPSYAPNQYGCHSDGRCLDDFDVWCDENDVSYLQDDFGNEWMECYYSEDRP